MVPGNSNFIQALWIIVTGHTHAEVYNKYLCYTRY